MSQYPEGADVFVNKTGSDFVASSDPNNAYDAIETTQGLIGALGKPQSWSTTMMTLLRQFIKGNQVSVSGGTITVRAGEAVLENTDGSKFAFRKNTADVELSSANLDAGTLAATTYYVYLTGGTAATTSPIMFSTDINAPSGIGTAPYRKIGWFENEVAAALGSTYAGSHEAGTIINTMVKSSVVEDSGGGTIPSDDTPPLWDEVYNIAGLDITYTPKTATSKIILTYTIQISTDQARKFSTAIFKNPTGSDECVAAISLNTGQGDWVIAHTMIYEETSGSTAARTYKIGYGDSGGSIYAVNKRNASGSQYGGTMQSLVKIEEIAT